MRKLLYIDLFCGAGGTSTGVEAARLHGEKCAHVLACVNHDPNAIKSHAANHPDAIHFTEDIRTLETTPLTDIVNEARRAEPDALVVLWASLECTNFSKAKGGQPRDADSRTLANPLFRYIEAINPDYIQIENVVEFMSWGEIDENGKLTGNYVGEIVDGKRKAELLRLIAQVEKVDLQQTIAVGDGANDLPMLSEAGLGIAFDAKPRVVANARQSINTIGLDGVLYFLGFKDSYLDANAQ